MRQCAVLSEHKNKRCLDESVWGNRYCLRHYPKRGIVYGFLGGTFLGIIVISLLRFSPDDFMQRFRLFYYLDRTPPQIQNFCPDVRRFKQVDRHLRNFQIEAEDNGSGIDWNKSRIIIKRDMGGHAEEIRGQKGLQNNYLKFQAESDLEDGNYFMEAFLKDRADRETHFMDSFTVEPGDLGITVQRHSFEKDKDSEGFESVFKSPQPPQGPLMVYRINLFHQAPTEAILKNLKVQTEFPGPVIFFREIGSSGTDRKIPFPPSANGVWKQKFFSDRKWMEIGELDAHGMVAFAVLVKCDEIQAAKYTAMPFSGSYEYQSYRQSGARNMGLWVPAFKEKKK